SLKGRGGQGGIRTLETVPRLHTFQACAFDHSATCPRRSNSLICLRGARLLWGSYRGPLLRRERPTSERCAGSPQYRRFDTHPLIAFCRPLSAEERGADQLTLGLGGVLDILSVVR